MARPTARPAATRARPKPPRARKSRLGLWTTFALLILVAAYLGVLELARPHVSGDRVRFDTWVELVETGKVRTARVLDQDSFVVGEYQRPDGTQGTYNAPLVTGFQGSELFNRLLLGNRVPTTVDQQVKKKVASLAAFLLPGMMLVVLFAYLILSSRRGTGLFKIRSGARKIEAQPGGVTFADVAGQAEAVAELAEVTDYLGDPERFAALGAEIPRGILLYGPPGCGKTLLAKALAGEAGASFYSISGSDFVELYVGVGAARVRDLFKEARENAPAVIFIDELDSIGRARGTGMGAPMAHVEQEQALNQILAEMDGFSTSDGILVVAATNRPDVLDPALLRPGRFDRTVALGKPDAEARLAILSLHARNKRLDPGVDLVAVAEAAIGLSGADLAAVANEAALAAARAGHDAVTQADLEAALQRALEAPEHQRRLSLRARSIGRRYAEGDKVTFDHVAGQAGAVAELSEVARFLAEPDRYRTMGARVPRGILLYGPPGCGKTLLARALAGEAKAAFFSVGASEFVQSFAGEGAARLRDLFADARAAAPAIVFLDELDSLGRSRVGTAGDRVGGSGEQEQALNQLLAELDGFTTTEGVIVVGATNRPDVLDPALLRPGRFDRSIGLDRLDEAGRLAVLELHAEGKRLGPEASLADVARRSQGLSGADLANLLNEAALLAARGEGDAIGQTELDEALSRVMAAPQRQRRLSLRSRSVGRRFVEGEEVSFADLAGVDDAVEELRDVQAFLADPGRFEAMGASPPRGILLAGPPGCGKTLLARAVAGEADAAFFFVSASELVEIFVGEGAARVRDLFAEARASAPAIVFIDEIDAVGGRRVDVSVPGQKERETTLNQILVELDGFEPRSGVLVIAATNRADTLDPALVRPGRFDRKVEITLPDRAGREAILALHARGKPLGPDADLGVLAGLTPGFSGADLANVVNEAALLATRRGLTRITMDLLDEAVDRASLGTSSRVAVLSPEERRVVAYHEAGHVLVARAVGADPPTRVTILPRGATLGHCSLVASHDRLLHSRSWLLARMATYLGGWAAEKLVFGETGTGAGEDLRRVNDLARLMVCELGMSELGPVVGSGDGGPSSPVSEEARSAMRSLTDEAYEQARRALEADRDLLDAVVEALLERETLRAADIDALAMAPAPAPRRRRSARTPSGG